MLFLVAFDIILASCLASFNTGHSYIAYSPISLAWNPYQSVLTPYTLKTPIGYTSYLNSPWLPLSIAGGGELKSQYHTQDAWGEASYGHFEADQSHNAIQDAGGNKIGSFSYIKPDGTIHRTDYVADAAGYRAASNDLPVGPSAPLHTLRKRSVYSPAVPLVTPNGYLADTPEVAAAKAAHFAEHAKLGNYHVSSQVNAYATPPYYTAYSASHAYYNKPPAYYSPYATTVVTPNGYLADTPEVAAAKAAHFAEKAKVSSHYNSIPLSDLYPIDPYAPVSGLLSNIPQVSAAKAAHLAEQADGLTRTDVARTEYDHSHSVYEGAASPSSYYASPVITASGHLADTPEVARAKAAHFAEYAAVASRQKRSAPYWGQTPASTVPLVPYSLHHTVTYSHPLNSYLLSKPLTGTTVVHGPRTFIYHLH